MARKPIVGLQDSTLFTHFDTSDCWLFTKLMPTFNKLTFQAIKDVQKNVLKATPKRGVAYMVLTVATLLKQSSLKVTPLIKLCVYSYVCSNSIQEHHR